MHKWDHRYALQSAHAGVIVKFDLPAAKAAYDAPATAFCKLTDFVL
ncbi:MAG TPA: hypothetical protein VKD89_11520 [Candidatus Udaeobacter sp.]|nr:hypothetical protein [Candidatus Udaeobacter sp.]